MSIIVTITCDGDGCDKAIASDNPDTEDVLNDYPDGWVHDEDNGLDYCHNCFEKIKDDEADGEGNFSVEF